MTIVLGEQDTFGINESFGAPEKNFSVNFSKTKTNLAWVSITMCDNSYFFVIFFKFIVDNRNVNFPIHFCLGCISNKCLTVSRQKTYL